MVSRFNPPLIDVLPFVQFYYTMDNNILDYVSSEKDLGAIMNKTLNFTEHTIVKLIRFGLLKLPAILLPIPLKGVPFILL